MTLDVDSNSSEDSSEGGPQPGAYQFQVRSQLDEVGPAVERLIALCKQHCFEGTKVNLNFRTGALEAITNAALHGNQLRPEVPVHVEIAFASSTIRLRVEDAGTGFDPEALPDPTDEEFLERSSGRGVFMMRSLMDEVVYNEAGNAVLCILHLQPRPR